MDEEKDEFLEPLIGETFMEIKKDEYIFTIEELRAIYRTVEYQYISYEDSEAHKVFTEIGKILREHDMARGLRSNS